MTDEEIRNATEYDDEDLYSWTPNRKVTIPNWNLEKFYKTVEKLNKKGGNIQIDDQGEDLYHAKLEDGTEMDVLVHHFEIENKTIYEVPGWEFIGTIEHATPQNIIRTNRDDVQIPDKYWTCGKECEHCHTTRDRKDTYLVRNTETGEFKQVGRSCLKAYTGLDPIKCMWCLDLDNYLNSLEFDEDDFRTSGGRYNGFVGFDTRRVIALGIAEIKANGYTSTQYVRNFEDSTKYKVWDKYHKDNAPVGTPEEIAEVDAWVENRVPDSMYEKNAKTAYNLQYCQYRDFAFILSYINMCYREKQKAQEKAIRDAQRKKDAETSQYVGKVGDKITFKVMDVRVLYTMEPYAYGAGCTYAYRMVDEDGNVLIWKTGGDVQKGDKIRATVKSQSEYRGEKQTTVTRGKVLEYGDGGFTLSTGTVIRKSDMDMYRNDPNVQAEMGARENTNEDYFGLSMLYDLED